LEVNAHCLEINAHFLEINAHCLEIHAHFTPGFFGVLKKIEKHDFLEKLG
jgi:hypothetical protein